MPTQHDIFISHSSKDKALAEKLVDVLLTNGCDVSANRILCTSLEGMKIPAGTPSFIEFLRKEIQNPKLVILLLTENYFASTFCVCELGASWGMDLPTFPLMVPPSDNADLRGTLKVAQAGSILDEFYLDELRDSVKQLLGVEVRTARWNLKRDEFLGVAPKIIKKLPQPDKVDRASLEEADANYREALEEITTKNSEIDDLKEQIEALKKCKDAKEVKAVVREFTDDLEQFEALCKTAKNALQQVHPATRSALYWGLRGGEFCPTHDEWDDVKAAEEIDEVIDHEDNTCSADTGHPRVAKAEQALRELANFIREQEFDDQCPLIADFAEEYDFPLRMSNKEFWGQFLAYV